MAWTTPKTWSAEPLTSTDLNTYIRDNQTHLYNRFNNHTDYIADETGNYTTTSSTFVYVDGTNLALSLTTAGGDVLVGFAGTISNTSNFVHLNIAVDGSDYFLEDGIVGHQATSTYGYACSFVALIEGLSSGSHTFKLRWKTNSGSTATLYNGGGVANTLYHPQFWVQEI